jgi:hypothetical protein
MRPRIPSALVAAIALWALVSCVPNQENKFSSSIASPSSCETQSELTQVYSESPSPIAGLAKQTAVAALAFSADGKDVWVAYIHEDLVPGQLMRIHKEDWKIMHSLELATLNTPFTRFNGDASLIASVSRIPCPDSSYSCREPRVWNTDSGELISAPQSRGFSDVHDLAFSKQGDWLVTVIGPGLDIIDPFEVTRGIGKVFVGGEEKIVVGTINDSGNLVANGTDQKIIQVEEWDGQHLHDRYPWSFGPWSFKGEEATIDAIPIKLAISPNNKWLAVRSGDGLELRDISVRFVPQHGRVSLEHSSDGIMEFDSSRADS